MEQLDIASLLKRAKRILPGVSCGIMLIDDVNVQIFWKISEFEIEYLDFKLYQLSCNKHFQRAMMAKEIEMRIRFPNGKN